MHLNDRVIREELRKQAMSVPIPDDLWANISRELDRDAAKARSSSPLHPASRGIQVRQILAIGAAAGIFWLMVLPTGAHVDRVQQPAASPAPSVTAAGETPWDIPTEAQVKERKSPKAVPGGVDARRSGVEIGISF